MNFMWLNVSDYNHVWVGVCVCVCVTEWVDHIDSDLNNVTANLVSQLVLLKSAIYHKGRTV